MGARDCLEKSRIKTIGLQKGRHLKDQQAAQVVEIKHVILVWNGNFENLVVHLSTQFSITTFAVPALSRPSSRNSNSLQRNRGILHKFPCL